MTSRALVNSAPQTGPSTRASSIRSNNSVKIAELKRKHLLERHKIEEEQEKIEYARQMKALNRKKELLEANAEIEVAKAEEELEISSEVSEDHIDPVARVARFVEETSKHIPEWTEGASEDGRAPEPQEPELGWVQRMGTYTSQEPPPAPVNEFPRGGANDWGVFASVLGEAISKGFNLPKRECSMFNGNPMEFQSFIQSFRANIESQENNERARLSFLIQFCQGEARRAISSCVMLPPGEGYKKALSILKNMYGRDYVIAQAYIDSVVGGGPIKDNEGEKLMVLAQNMEACEINVRQLGCQSDINSGMTLEKVVKRLPRYLRADWAKRVYRTYEAGGIPTFVMLKEFINESALIAKTRFGQLVSERYERSADRQRPIPNSSGKQRVTTLKTNTVDPVGQSPRNRGDKRTCCFCQRGGHVIEQCFKFRKERYTDRKRFVRSFKLCDLCLQKGHFSSACKLQNLCPVEDCGKRHHPLLHQANVTATENLSPTTDSGSGSNDSTQVTPSPNTEVIQVSTTAATNSNGKKVSLPAVNVKVAAIEGEKEVEILALLDNCSDTTLCSEGLLKLLGVEGSPANYTLSTVTGDTQHQGCEVSLNVTSADGRYSTKLRKVKTIPKAIASSKNVPCKGEISRWTHLRDLDIHTGDERDVMLLIGNDYPGLHRPLEQRRGKFDEPFAIRTVLGWVVMGPIDGERAGGSCINVTLTDSQILERIEAMYRMDFQESSADMRQAMSVEDKKAMQIFEDSTKMIDGHYEIALPWKNVTPYLPNNRTVAEKRLQSLRRRLLKDTSLHEKYTNVIKEYVAKGYARKLEASGGGHTPEAVGPVWYLPHHPVFHPLKPGKVRVVFDCAAEFKNTSLNKQLLQGPDQTNSLVGVLMRFRQEQVAIVADVEAMFHQVRVRERDTDALRFLFWPDGNLETEPSEFKMVVHLFGAISSPSIAAYALRRCATDNQTKYHQETIKTVQRNFYVDDVTKSVATEEEAIMLARELRELLAEGGFRLTKWASNSKRVLNTIPESEITPSFLSLDLDKLPTERTLGMIWDVHNDTFRFRSVNLLDRTTRRQILSAISSIYDPLGIAAPQILPAKIILQRLCNKEYGWDDDIPEEDLKAWNGWVHDIVNLQDVAISRCYKQRSMKGIVDTQLHHFSDASNLAYGTATYIRQEDEEGQITCSLVLGKSRVTPKKPITIPRLELAAATLAVKVNSKISEELDVPVNSVTYWTDSTTVLRYIENEASRFQVYVANRLATIHDGSCKDQWKYVPTKENPADLVSRGFSASEDEKLTVWLNGPKFLYKGHDSWPTLSSSQDTEIETKLEWKKSAIVNKTEVRRGQSPTERIIERFSSWQKLKAAVAWYHKFFTYLRRGHKQNSNSPSICDSNQIKKYVTVNDLRRAERSILHYVQNQVFAEEIQILQPVPGTNEKSSQVQDRKDLKRKSTIACLRPFVIDNLLRVGGRLKFAPIPTNAKFPVIIPKDHHVTDLIIKHFHQSEGHSGTAHVLAALRQHYWIPNGVSQVRKAIGKCMDCRKRNATTGTQLMAPLPSVRVTPYKPPFFSVGIDYFGPLTVKRVRTNVKRYGCIFTCLATRAVHLEMANSLDAESFLCAFSRFTARRGFPEVVYSDNGSNFVSGFHQLKEEFERLKSEEAKEKIRRRLAVREIEWHFNPPGASHAGGVWERLIRSVRQILQSLIKEQLIDEEALVTFLAEVERILNDRPLVHQDDSTDELTALTPSMLLLHRINPSVALSDVRRADRFNRRWRQAQWLTDSFWRRWIRQYLPTLQQRQKWISRKRNFRPKDLVLIADDRIRRGNWPMGIIEEVFPDADGDIRHVIVRTAVSRMRRDVRKLCLLEGAPEEEGTEK